MPSRCRRTPKLVHYDLKCSTTLILPMLGLDYGNEEAVSTGKAFTAVENYLDNSRISLRAILEPGET